MPKVQFVKPENARKSGQIEFKPIPVNQYNTSVKDEVKRYGKEDIIRMERDMQIIRMFENMLNEIKLRGAFMGIEYMHNGPAHLSIGQEAAAVGQAYHLGIDDHIYGSHRSHGGHSGHGGHHGHRGPQCPRRPTNQPKYEQRFEITTNEHSI